MQVTILNHCECACFRGPHRVEPGATVEATPATNLPDHESKGLLWVEQDDDDVCYGLLLRAIDYRIDAGKVAR